MKFTAPLIERPLLAAFAVVAIGSSVALAVGGESAAPAWRSERQRTVLDTKHADSPRVRIAINHVLGQSQTPLLLQAPQQRIATDENAAAANVTSENASELAPAAEIAPVGEYGADEAGAAPSADESAQQQAADAEPQVVFGEYDASADGWRPAHLRSEPSEPSANRHDEAADDNSSRAAGRRFRPVTSAGTPRGNPAAAAAPPMIDSTASEAEAPAEAVAAPPANVLRSTSPQPNVPPANVRRSNMSPSNAPQSTAPRGESPANNDERSSENDRDSATPAAARSRQSAITAKTPTAPLPPLNQNMKNLRAKVRRVVKSYYTRPLNSRENDPWELMHGMLAYGVKSQIRQGGPQGQTITLVGWLCYNRPSKGFTLLYATPENELRAKQGVGLQGHMGQFLAMLAQCQVSPDYPIRVNNREFTINDLIRAEQKTCYARTELTFKLIALMHYLDSDATWVNDQGQSWDMQRLIREELAQPIRGAACGGTHRLSGLSLAARTRVRRGEPLDGEYLRAAQFVEKYQNYAFQLQNRDGSLSTEWFRGRGDEDDLDRRVKTTGHILEWLCYSLEDKDIRGPRAFRAANYLSTILASNFNHDWEVGPLGHAIHALRLYDERVFQPYDGLEDVAKKPVRKTAQRSNASRGGQNGRQM